jgi:hypothetical protein
VDAVLTVTWMVAVVNGVNFLDNADALAALVAALAGAGLAVLAGGESAVGVAGAAVAGACGAFWAFNARPAAIYLGDAGSMFLGFVLPALALVLVAGADAPVATTWSAVALLAFPVAEIAITSMRRVAHGIPAWRSGPDNLTHALIARGLAAAGASALQVAGHLVLVAVAVLVARNRLPWGAAPAVAAAVPFVFALATRGARVHGRPIGVPRPLRIFVVAAVLGGAAAAGVAAATTVAAYRSAAAGARLVEVATDHLREGDTARARDAFAGAARQLDRAERLLDGPWLAPARAVPVVAGNLDAARGLVAAAHDLAADGSRFAASVDPRGLRVRGARVPIASVRASVAPLEALARSVSRAESEVRSLDDRMLVGPVARTVGRARSALAAAAADTQHAAAAARIAPAVFGGAGARRYLVIAQNPAEARATGGIPGSFGLLDARSGTLSLADLVPVETLNAAARAASMPAVVAPDEYQRRYARFEPHLWWENTTMSPDFPTVASVMAQQYRAQFGTEVDGVVSLDPIALRGLLHLTGLVHVDGWPSPVTAGNVVSVLLRDQYARFTDGRERKLFLGRVTSAVWHAMERADLGSPTRLAATLGPVAAQRHLMVWLARPGEQRVVHDLGFGGGAPPATGDAFFATVQNAAGTKLDLYMSRTLRYDVTLTPVRSGHAELRAEAVVELANRAPRELPAFVAVGGAGVPEGALRSYVSLYSALDLHRARLDGRPVGLEAGRELGRRSYSTFLSVPRGGRVRLGMTLRGMVELHDGWYELQLFPQPGAAPERADVVVRVPEGYALTRATGCTVAARRTCRRAGPLERAGSIRVLVRRA